MAVCMSVCYLDSHASLQLSGPRGDPVHGRSPRRAADVNARAMRLTALLAVVAAQVLAPASAAEWRPTKTVEMIVPTSAGGGTDETARAIQAILQKPGT